MLLGKPCAYINQYSPNLLFPIKRGREASAFKGVDIWNAYEVSWLNLKGKPQVALGEFHIPAHSPNLIESKSFKLYLNSLNQTRFHSMQEVAETIAKDLMKTTGSKVQVSLLPLTKTEVVQFPGICLDSLDIEVTCYERNSSLLEIENGLVEETVYTNLFKSNCLVTGQPDWASVCISYTGRKINHQALLKYLISYRNHQGFHEHCTEQIFEDLMSRCAPESLSVYARFVRRGGLDINCFRTTPASIAECFPIRLIRQ